VNQRPGDVSGLMVKGIWGDEHFFELECTVDKGAFCGTATCYTGHGELAMFAEALRRFAQTFEGTAIFTAALADATKAVTIDIRAVDHAKHAAATVKLVTERGFTPDDVARLEVQFPVEDAGIDAFLHELGNVHKPGDFAFLPAAR
jgi:hypothetical protein